MEKIYSKQKNRKKKNFFPQDFPFNGSLLSLSFPPFSLSSKEESWRHDEGERKG